MSKQQTIFVSLLLVVIILSSLTTATTKIPRLEDQNTNFIQDFFNKIAFEYGQKFSVVGDNRDCSKQPDKEWTVDARSGFEADASDYCSSDYGLFNTYKGWEPMYEFKGWTEFHCGAGNDCQVQLYCCPYEEPDNDEDCQEKGYPEGAFKRVSCSQEKQDWKKDGSSGWYYSCPNENNILYEDSSYSYCECQRKKTCFYYDYGNCDNTRTYCDIQACSEVGSYMGNSLYDSKTACQQAQQQEEEEPTDGQDETDDQTDEAGDIRVTEFNFPEERDHWDDYFGKKNHKITVTVKNFGEKTDTINLEGGFYTKDYATDVAQLYSTQIFSSVVPEPNCNEMELFVKTKQITLEPGETEEVTLEVSPLNVMTTWGIGLHDVREAREIISFAGLYEECLGGYTNDAGTTGKGTMFDYKTFPIRHHSMCGVSSFKIYCGQDLMGECEDHIMNITKKCDIPETSEIVKGNVTECSTDGDCEEGQRCVKEMCVEYREVEKPNEFCEFIEPLAFADITGDKCVDASIILGAIMMMFMLILKMGNKK